jgi:predicted AlkP superfamily phosphohydrolase/phosphomutase
MSAGIAAVYCTGVRYLRMLSNSILAGALAATYVVVLLLLLNPSLPTDPRTFGPLALSVGAFYTAYCAAAAYLLLIVRQVVGREMFSPAWVSVTVLAWLGAVAAAVGAVVFWANISTFALVLEPRTVTALTQGVIALAATALLLLIIALLQAYGGRRIVWAAWLVAVIGASIAVPLAFRGPAERPPLEARSFVGVMTAPVEHEARVSVIALDAGSLELITSAAAEGRLPNFGRILDAGAVAHLATLHPTSPEAVWTAVATGKLPQKNGVRSAAVYRLAGRSRSDALELLPDHCLATGLLRFGILSEDRLTSASVRAMALWSILSRAGISVSVLNFPLTYPAPILRGFAVSDTYARNANSPSEFGDPKELYPFDLRDDVMQALASEETARPPLALEGIAERFRAPSRTDLAYETLRRTLAVTHPTQVSIMRFASTDPIGHYFLRYAMPSRFGDVSDDERRRLGGVLEAHYGLVDDAIGRAIAALEPEDLLLVVSGFGIEPLGVGKRVLERLIGDPDVSGTHEAAPDGFLMAYGASVAKTRQLRRASVVDVVPTILYFLGLPIGRDMDGYARVDLFQPAFTREHPMTFVPTHEQ